MSAKVKILYMVLLFMSNIVQIYADEKKTEIILFCGAGIRPLAEAFIREFETREKTKILATYGGSGPLLGQISTMKRGDLFMPGEEQYADIAIEKGLADASTKQKVACFIPVILVRKGLSISVTGVKDLTRPGLRLGFGDERSAAVGQVTLSILKKNGIDPGEITKSVVYKSGTVDELGIAIKMGTIDATIVWDATARYYTNFGTIVEIPPENNVFSIIPIVVLKFSEHPDVAKKFVEFVTSDRGKEIVKNAGWSLIPPASK
jgi:molybdate transport system substrate-binding protein